MTHIHFDTIETLFPWMRTWIAGMGGFTWCIVEAPTWSANHHTITGYTASKGMIQ